MQIWDVSCQRQVQIKGPDAARLVQLMTPRDLSRAQAGDCLYVPIIDDAAGLINDPVLLKHAEGFWLSIADSDVLLYAKGIAIALNLRVMSQNLMSHRSPFRGRWPRTCWPMSSAMPSGRSTFLSSGM